MEVMVGGSHEPSPGLFESEAIMELPSDCEAMSPGPEPQLGTLTTGGRDPVEQARLSTTQRDQGGRRVVYPYPDAEMVPDASTEEPVAGGVQADFEAPRALQTEKPRWSFPGIPGWARMDRSVVGEWSM